MRRSTGLLTRVAEDVETGIAIAEEKQRGALAVPKAVGERPPEMNAALGDEEAHFLDSLLLAEVHDPCPSVVVRDIGPVHVRPWVGLDLVDAEDPVILHGEGLVKGLRDGVRVEDPQVGVAGVVQLHVAPPVECGPGLVLRPERPERDVEPLCARVRGRVVEHQVHGPMADADRRTLLVVVVSLASAEEPIRQQAVPRAAVALSDDHHVVAEVLAGGDLRGEEATAAGEDDRLLLAGRGRDRTRWRWGRLADHRVRPGIRSGGETAATSEDRRPADHGVRLAGDRGREAELTRAVLPRIRSRRHLEKRPVRREVLVRRQDELVVRVPVGLVAVPLRGCELRHERVGEPVVRIRHKDGVRRVVDVQQHLTGVPIGDEQEVVPADPLALHVVVEDRVAVGVRALGARPVLEPNLGQHDRAGRIRDVEDVHVRQVLVVLEEGEDPVLPAGEDAALDEQLGAVRRVVGLARDSGARVAEVERQRRRRERVRHIPERRS